MTPNRELFENRLDRNANDHMTRLVYADWLEEHGDASSDLILVAGLRFEARQGLRPFLQKRPGSQQGKWRWRLTGRHNCSLPTFLWKHMTRGLHFLTRREAELALAMALSASTSEQASDVDDLSKLDWAVARCRERGLIN